MLQQNHTFTTKMNVHITTLLYSLLSVCTHDPIS